MLLNDEVFDFTDFTSDTMLYSARRGEIKEWRRGKEGERTRESGGELYTIVTVEKVFNFTSDQ